MLKLGNLIEEDIYLLELDSVDNNQSWQENYKFHLLENEFKSFKIGIPYNHKNALKGIVSDFIENTNLNGSYFVYFNVEQGTNLPALIEDGQEEISLKKLFLLPHMNLTYSKFSTDFWDLNLLGYEIHILKCDRMKECQSNPKTMKKYMLKGARIGISGSNKYSFGIFHKRKITQLFNANLINYWITECINHNDSSRLHEIKIKTELLMSEILTKRLIFQIGS
jgi:hypothetical protein